MRYLVSTILFVGLLLLTQCTSAQKKQNPYYSHTSTETVNLSNAEWKKILPDGVYYITRLKGTERAFTGELTDNHKAGTYYCAACGHPLFSSDAKFESGTGWPSFFQPMNNNSIKNEPDADGDRIEVVCSRCGGHLGHVFEDGPKPTGRRYCMNSAALDFEAGNAKEHK